MAGKTIGNFEISVSQPYPCWVTLTYQGVDMSFPHTDLRDLEHAVATAIRQANSMLGPRESVDGNNWAREPDNGA